MILKDIIPKTWQDYANLGVYILIFLFFIYAGQAIVHQFHISPLKQWIFWPIYLGVVLWIIQDMNPPFKNRKKSKLSDIQIKEKLQRLQEIGITLFPGITIDNIRNELNDDSYESLLIAMGGEVEQDDKWVSLSPDIWHFDAECIYDHGDYTQIATRLCNMAGGDLPLQDIKDFVDVDAKVAWISFVLDKKEYKWDLAVDDDWLDSKLFFMFAQLLKERDCQKSFVEMPLGQDLLITFCTPEQLRILNKLPGIKFKL